MAVLYDYIQTFFIDPNAVSNAREVIMVSVDLWFKRKPTQTANRSNTIDPGVTISICETNADGTPNVSRIIQGSQSHLNWTQIYATTNGLAETTFPFQRKINLQTNKFYGICISYHDSDYELWSSTQGDRMVLQDGTITNTPSPGQSGRNDGSLYTGTNTGTFRPIAATDLKFRANIAKFSVPSDLTIKAIPKNYEFFTYSSKSTANFIAGELVYQNVASETGTVNIISGDRNIRGTSTSFNSSALVGHYIVVQSASAASSDVRRVVSVANSTYLTLESPPTFSDASGKFKIAPVGRIMSTYPLQQRIYLTDSSANSSNKFQTGQTFYGDQSGAYANIATIFDYSIDTFVPDIEIRNPVGFSTRVKHVFATNTGGVWRVNSSQLETTQTDPNSINRVTQYDGYIMSRSNEVTYPSNLYDPSGVQKSSYFEFTFASTGTNQNSTYFFETPLLDENKLDIFTFQNDINNDSTNEWTNRGRARSKHVSTKVNFADNRYAEDIRVYLTAYRPSGTDIKVYAKIHNSHDIEPFDDKSWTELDLKDGVGRYSSIANENDYVDLTFGFPAYPPTLRTFSNPYVTTEVGNSVVLTSADLSGSIAPNDLVKIYASTLSPTTNYAVGVVSTANSTAITLVDPNTISSASVAGAGLVIEKLGYNSTLAGSKSTAFNNYLNDNIVRYYNRSMVEFDTYDTFSVKIVFLSNSSFIVPRVQDMRAIGVSA